MSLPTQYQWLAAEPGPLMLLSALEFYGVHEVDGAGNNPTILGWAKELGSDMAAIYKADDVPWCGLFMAFIAKKANKQAPKDPLWALNWGTFGVYTDTPMLGDVLVFVRKTSDGKKAGHVGLYVGEDSKFYHVLGGNTSDAVSIARIEKSRLYAARRPKYNIVPKNVKVIKISGVNTAPSVNEA